jgi:hypothetical protein
VLQYDIAEHVGSPGFSPVCTMPAACRVSCLQVVKASASDEQDQRRLLLSVNHKGTILQVNTGTLLKTASFTYHILPAFTAAAAVYMLTTLPTCACRHHRQPF